MGKGCGGPFSVAAVIDIDGIEASSREERLGAHCGRGQKFPCDGKSRGRVEDAGIEGAAGLGDVAGSKVSTGLVEDAAGVDLDCVGGKRSAGEIDHAEVFDGEVGGEGGVGGGLDGEGGVGGTVAGGSSDGGVGVDQ